MTSHKKTFAPSVGDIRSLCHCIDRGQFCEISAMVFKSVTDPPTGIFLGNILKYQNDHSDKFGGAILAQQGGFLTISCLL